MKEQNFTSTKTQVDKFSYLLKALWFIGPPVLAVVFGYGTMVRVDANRENKILQNSAEIASLKSQLAEIEKKREIDRDRYATKGDLDRWMTIQRDLLEDIRRNVSR